MEEKGEINMANPLHLGAVQAIGGRLVKYACDAALHVWNDHPIRARGGGRSLGTPTEIRAAAPQLSVRLALPPMDKVIDAYAESSNAPLDAQPSWADAVDALRGQPERQEVRRLMVGAVLGDDQTAWSDVLHSNGARFRRAVAKWVAAR